MSQYEDNSLLVKFAEESRQFNLSGMEALTEFVINNAELEQLEERLRQFNIFEAVGMNWQEIRHSAFLAFLFDPEQPHGLGDDFLKKALQRALLGTNVANLPVDVVSLHLWSLEETTVQREWNGVDILLCCEPHRLVVIVENKTGMGEHDDQLKRYHRLVSQRYPDWRILGIYLTPEGAKPSDARYLPLSYKDVANLVEKLTITRENALGPDIRTLMTHYVQLLRRTIVSDPQIDALCRDIYHKHRRAIDLIVSRIPDKQAQIMDYCKSLVETRPELRLRYAGRTDVGFHPITWDTPALQYYPPEQSRGLLFEIFFRYETKGLTLMASIRPGRQEVRQKLFDMVQAHADLFRTGGRLYSQYNRVYSRALFPARDLQNVELSSLQTTIALGFDKFLQTDLPRIQQIMNDEAWIWAKDAPYANEGMTVEDNGALEENEPE